MCSPHGAGGVAAGQQGNEAWLAGARSGHIRRRSSASVSGCRKLSNPSLLGPVVNSKYTCQFLREKLSEVCSPSLWHNTHALARIAARGRSPTRRKGWWAVCTPRETSVCVALFSLSATLGKCCATDDSAASWSVRRGMAVHESGSGVWCR